VTLAHPVRSIERGLTITCLKLRRRNSSLAAAGNLPRYPAGRRKLEKSFMLKKTLLAATMTVFMAAPAFAFGCPSDMASIDAALANTSLTGDALAEVKAWRAQGEEEHGSGNHAESVATLAKALAALDE
jgi:hypothetical protein